LPDKAEEQGMPTIRHACLSDLGKTHQENEDRWYVDHTFGLYLVSDGMAHAEPAQLVVESLPKLLRSHLAGVDDLSAPAASPAVQFAIRDVSRKIQSTASAKPQKDWLGLGATIVQAIVRPPYALLAHLGDSRIYLHRADRLEALTHDHSLLQELICAGKLSVEESQRYRFNGGPTRFAGMVGDAEADIRLLHLQLGDRLILCSDGLTCMLSDESIQAIMSDQPSPEDACRCLIDAANAAGGEDNITVLIVGID
jgi:protein phosphatase